MQRSSTRRIVDARAVERDLVALLLDSVEFANYDDWPVARELLTRPSAHALGMLAIILADRRNEAEAVILRHLAVCTASTLSEQRLNPGFPYKHHRVNHLCGVHATGLRSDAAAGRIERACLQAGTANFVSSQDDIQCRKRAYELGAAAPTR
jgi:hypothetical protein